MALPRPLPGGCPSVPVSVIAKHCCGCGSNLEQCLPTQPTTFRTSAVATLDAPLAAFVGDREALSPRDMLQLHTLGGRAHSR